MVAFWPPVVAEKFSTRGPIFRDLPLGNFFSLLWGRECRPHQYYHPHPTTTCHVPSNTAQNQVIANRFSHTCSGHSRQNRKMRQHNERHRGRGTITRSRKDELQNCHDCFCRRPTTCLLRIFCLLSHSRGFGQILPLLSPAQHHRVGSSGKKSPWFHKWTTDYVFFFLPVVEPSKSRSFLGLVKFNRPNVYVYGFMNGKNVMKTVVSDATDLLRKVFYRKVSVDHWYFPMHPFSLQAWNLFESTGHTF